MQLCRFNVYFEHPASQRAIAQARGIRGVASPALGSIYYKKTLPAQQLIQ